MFNRFLKGSFDEKEIFLFIEGLGVLFLYLIPCACILYIMVYEVIHFFHPSIESFILSGKLPIFFMLLIFMIEIIIHFTFRPQQKKLLYKLGIKPKVRRYKIGYWATNRSQNNKQTLYNKNGFLLLFTLVSILILAIVWFQFRLPKDYRHSLSGIAPFFYNEWWNGISYPSFKYPLYTICT